MKMTKKILAILLSAVLVLSLLAACSKKEEGPAAQSGNNDSTEAANDVPVGMLVFCTDASLSLQYNAEGIVVSVEANNADGTILLETTDDVVGLSCVDAVAAMTNYAIECGTLSNNLIIKQSVGSNVLSDDFLQTLVEAAEKAAAAQNVTANIIAISVDDLDENGYISVASAKEIVMGLMGVESLDSFDGDDSVDASGEYLFYVTAGDVQTAFVVHGIFGLCTELSEDDLRLQVGEPGEPEDPAFEETEPFDNLPTEDPTEFTEPEGTEPEGTESED